MSEPANQRSQSPDKAKFPPRDSAFDPLAYLLRFKTPEDVFSALSQGDALQITARSHSVLKTECLLLDLDRLCRRSTVRVAIARPSYEGEPDLDAWLDIQIRDAIRDLLLEDLREATEGVMSLEEWDPRYGFLTDMVGVAPEKARLACVKFNQLTWSDRACFFSACVDNLNLPQLLERTQWTRTELRESLIRCFEALLDKKDLMNDLDERCKRGARYEE